MAIEFQVSFDANNPPKLADFWAQALGYVTQPPPPGFATWEEFAVKNNIPFDSVDRLVSLGATRVREHNDQTGHWVVMLDPEGNEFCVS